MPVTKSAKKALKRDIRRHQENSRIRLKLKNSVDPITKGESKTHEDLSQAYSAIDRAIKNNLVSKNKGARVKSRLSRLIDKPKLTSSNKKSVTGKPASK